MSCNSRNEEKKELIESKETTELVAQDLHEIKVDIKGMTCEIGCAKLIQSKLYKADGVTFAEVSFQDSSGIVKFDQNRISEEEIKNVIEGAAGGGIYSVASIEELPLEETTAQ